MQDHCTRISEALERYRMVNHRPAVDEPDNDFEQAVNEHAALQDFIAEVKSLLKPAETEERKKRDALAASLDAYFKTPKEGVNNYELSNGRVLKYTHNKSRSIDESQIQLARDEYAAATDIPSGLAFDQLLRVKYELDKKAYNKVAATAQAGKAISRMIVTKPAASKIEVD